MFWAHRNRIVAATLTVAAGLLIGGMPGGAAAHDGEEAPPPASLMVAPRVVAHSDLYDLVGVAHRRTLSVYLTEAMSDAPVEGAKIEVDADGQHLAAAPDKDGIYTLSADWVERPGHHDAVFTIIAKPGSDLLAGTIEVPSPAMPQGDAARALQDVSRADVLAFLLGMLVMLGLVSFNALAAAVGPRLRPVALAALSVLRAAPAALADIRGAAARWPQRGTGERMVSPLLPERAVEFFPRVRYRGRVEAAILAVICLLLIATAALFLISRGVFAHEGEESAAPAAAAGGAFDSPHRLLDGSLFVPEFTQRLLHLRTVVGRVKRVARSIRMVGRVIPDPGTSGEVHAMVRGRLEPVEGKWPQVGQKVEKDQVLAWVVPVVNPIDRGIILQQVSQIDKEIALAQQRLKQLVQARAAAALAEARDHLTNLLQRREAIGTVLRDRDNLRAPLRAPSSGVIAASFAVAGQVVDEQDKLFQVVDLRRLWVEAYAYDVLGLGDVLRANAESSIGRGYSLDFVSRGPQLERQTIPLFFKIANPDPALSVGSLLSVLVETTGEQRSGVVLPRTAVTRDASGQQVVWQHTHPESFVPVPVRVEPVDGHDVLIAAGLRPDSRVVVQAAELLSQIR